MVTKTVEGKALSTRSASAPCLLCGHGERDLVVIGYDRWFARAGEYAYYRCRACGLLALDPLPSASDLASFYPPAYFARLDGPPRKLDKRINRLAIRYYYGVESRGRSRVMRHLFAALSGRVLAGILPVHGAARLLDVGCGTGAALDTYRRLGWQVAGIDQSADAVTHARARGLRVHHGDVFDAPFAAEFDVVLLSHVIEHVRDPIAVLARAATFLAAGGKIVVLTPNARSLGLRLYGSCWFALEAPRHVMLFDPRTIALLARKAGLTAARVTTRGDANVLSWSRRYARTQGYGRPAGLSEDAGPHGEAPLAPADRGFRELMVWPSWIAARLGAGELLQAVLTPSSERGIRRD